MMRRLWAGPVLVAGALLLAVGVAGQQRAGLPERLGGVPSAGEWRRTGGDGGSTRYSPLDQITAQNVKSLQMAWTWRGDNYGSAPEYKNETTPIMVDGVLYFTA